MRDAIRQAAYDWALSVLAGRQGLFASLTDEERDAIKNYDGLEIAGSHDEIPGAPVIVRLPPNPAL